VYCSASVFFSELLSSRDMATHDEAQTYKDVTVYGTLGAVDVSYSLNSLFYEFKNYDTLAKEFFNGGASLSHLSVNSMHNIT
jgi:hypothetical protein